MDAGLFVRGLVLGFSIAAPVGPIGVLCIRRTLAHGRVAGLVSGLGAATADAVYGSIAGFGITAISTFLTSQAVLLQLLGGLFLCYLGITTFLATPAEQAAPIRSGGLAGAYVSTFALTLTNPMTIFSFAAIFAGLGLVAAEASYGAALMLVSGVFGGSALWWLLLSGGANLFRTHLTPHTMGWINKMSGSFIALVGIISLASCYNSIW